MGKAWGKVVNYLYKPLLFFMLFIAFGFFPALPQTQAELEDQILRGGGEAAVATQPNAEPNSKSSAKQTNRIQEESEEEFELAPRASSRSMRRVEEAVLGPRRIPPEHILVIQRKYIEKENRHEITPLSYGFQLADSFRRQFQWGFGYAYHFSEFFGLEFLHANVISNFSTGLNQQILTTLGLETDRIEPVYSVGSSLQITPLRSKAAAWSSTVYFEGFFLAGGGMTRYETSTASMAMAGVGFRVYLTRYAILKTEFRNYTDFRAGRRNHRFNVISGASVLFGGVK